MRTCSLTWSRRAYSSAITLLALMVGACSKPESRPALADNDVDAVGPVYGPTSNEACSPEGEQRECGKVYHSDGDYVTCSVGQTTCTDGKWTPCEGDHYVIRSASQLRLTAYGLRLMATTAAACSNVCDPYCSSFSADPADVVVEGIVAADAGGLTLQEYEYEATSSDCTGMQCQLVVCAGNATTTISGIVYDPAGRTPLYNAEVYVPLDPRAPLPPFSSGASCDTCGGAATSDALRATQTDAAGRFTLADVPAGSNVPVVVQMGKWRREIVLSSVASCTSNAVAGNCTAPDPADCVFRLPRSQKDGYDPALGTYTKADLPQMAIVTGSADPFDCLLLKAGIDPAEIGDYKSNRRIHFYASDDAPGNALQAKYGAKEKGSTLWNRLSGGTPSLMQYDAVLLPCEGGAYDKQKTTGLTTPYQNLIDYVNRGGRVFATHFSYSWLAFPGKGGYASAPDDWSTVASWTPAKLTYNSTSQAWTGSSVNTQDPLTALLDTTFPKGAVFSQWLKNVRASARTGKIALHEGRQDLSAIGGGAQSWMSARNLTAAGSPTYSNLFTFNTPYGSDAAKQCGRVVFTDFHVSANARTQCPATGPCIQACIGDEDCGYTATCVGSVQGSVGQCVEPCSSNRDCPNTSYACQGLVAGQCEQTACTKDANCGTGRTCQDGQCQCVADADCNGGACANKLCDPGASCHSNADCGASGTCGTGAGATLGTCTAGFVCHTDSECGPTGTCGSGSSSTKGTCARTTGTLCHRASECDSNSCGAGTGSTAGNCATNAQICHRASECDSNSCGTGTGSTAGTCAKGAATLCHTNADCDSNSCGGGLGATAGACSTSATVCHANEDCDSGSCGVGTGAITGTCATNAQLCHRSSDCDSNSCGSGTGSTTGTCANGSGASCHRNADCDSNFCGSGTGSAKGTCAIAAGASCHLNADCDSNSCGTGLSGSSKGTCSGSGTCTTSTQCTGGATCSGGRCVGACSVDTNCGTGGACNGATCTAPATCASDAACVKSLTCSGAKCSAPAACTSDAACPVSGLCNGAKCSNALACTNDQACSVSRLCNGAKCSTKTCAGDAACPVNGLCNNAKCSTPAACAGDAACPASGTCNNAKCATAKCAGDGACSVSNLCNGAKCSTAVGCAGDAACPASGLCSNAKCSTSKCANDGQCPLRVCTAATCGANACSSDSDCPGAKLCGGTCASVACSTSADCASGGPCVNGVCGCTAAQDCGGSQICEGGVQGNCARSCSTDADCAPDQCVDGQCGGCASDSDCHDYGYTGSCSGVPPENFGVCSAISTNAFPLACRQGELTPQEKALEFMFFDLTACVSPDDLPPPKPVTSSDYRPASFVQDFTAACPYQTKPAWRDVAWQAVIPDGASIVLAAQSGVDIAELQPSMPLLIAEAKTSTDVGLAGQSYDVALIDTGAGGNGAFNTASPRVLSAHLLRLTLTLNPSETVNQPPRLIHWKVQYDCLPDQ